MPPEGLEGCVTLKAEGQQTSSARNNSALPTRGWGVFRFVLFCRFPAMSESKESGKVVNINHNRAIKSWPQVA